MYNSTAKWLCYCLRSAPSCLLVCIVENQILRRYIHTSGPPRLSYLSSNLGFKLHFSRVGLSDGLPAGCTNRCRPKGQNVLTIVTFKCASD